MESVRIFFATFLREYCQKSYIMIAKLIKKHKTKINPISNISMYSDLIRDNKMPSKNGKPPDSSVEH